MPVGVRKRKAFGGALLSLFLFSACAGGIVRQPGYLFTGVALGDAKTIHCERTEIIPTQPSPMEEVVHTRCTSNEGGHFSKSGWDVLLGVLSAIGGYFLL